VILHCRDAITCPSANISPPTCICFPLVVSRCHFPLVPSIFIPVCSSPLEPSLFDRRLQTLWLIAPPPRPLCFPRGNYISVWGRSLRTRQLLSPAALIPRSFAPPYIAAVIAFQLLAPRLLSLSLARIVRSAGK
jgi:hypothetical protein